MIKGILSIAAPGPSITYYTIEHSYDNVQLIGSLKEPDQFNSGGLSMKFNTNHSELIRELWLDDSNIETKLEYEYTEFLYKKLKNNIPESFQNSIYKSNVTRKLILANYYLMTVNRTGTKNGVIICNKETSKLIDINDPQLSKYSLVINEFVKDNDIFINSKTNTEDIENKYFLAWYKDIDNGLLLYRFIDNDPENTSSILIKIKED